MLRIDERGLLGQEAVTADQQLLVVGEAERAERLSLVEVGLEPAKQLLLALGGLALGGRAMAALGREPLEALLDDREVRHGELQVEVGDVAPRIGVRCECIRHVDERIGVADQGEDLWIDRPLPGRSFRDGDVDVGDVGMGRLLRDEQARQLIEPLVGHLHHAQVRGGPTTRVAARLGMAPGEGVEHRRLPAARHADEGDLHRPSSRRRDRRRCAAPRRHGRDAGCR